MLEIQEPLPTDRYALTASNFAGSNCGGGGRDVGAELDSGWLSVAGVDCFSDMANCVRDDRDIRSRSSCHQEIGLSFSWSTLASRDELA